MNGAVCNVKVLPGKENILPHQNSGPLKLALSKQFSFLFFFLFCLFMLPGKILFEQRFPRTRKKKSSRFWKLVVWWQGTEGGSRKTSEPLTVWLQTSQWVLLSICLSVSTMRIIFASMFMECWWESNENFPNHRCCAVICCVPCRFWTV